MIIFQILRPSTNGCCYPVVLSAILLHAERSSSPERIWQLTRHQPRLREGTRKSSGRRRRKASQRVNCFKMLHVQQRTAAVVFTSHVKSIVRPHSAKNRLSTAAAAATNPRRRSQRHRRSSCDILSPVLDFNQPSWGVRGKFSKYAAARSNGSSREGCFIEKKKAFKCSS